MAASQLEKSLAVLRMGLAEIEHKEQQLNAQISQFRAQLLRVPRQVIYGAAGLEAALAAMGEIEERLADAEAVRRRLRQIKNAAAQELESLLVLKRVDEARANLAAMKRQPPADGNSDAQAAEIRRLEEYINANSKLAEQIITARYQERLEQTG